jgi:uncharacterized membrane protein
VSLVVKSLTTKSTKANTRITKFDNYYSALSEKLSVLSGKILNHKEHKGKHKDHKVPIIIIVSLVKNLVSLVVKFLTTKSTKANTRITKFG